VAFEPQPDAASSLRRNAQLNGFSMVEVVEAALSSWTGKGALAGIGKATAHIIDGRERDPLSVEVTTLDESLGGRSEPPVVVKTDLEGKERDVLAGMAMLLESHSPILVVETHGTVAEVRADLACLGYTTTALGASHLLGVPV